MHRPRLTLHMCIATGGLGEGVRVTTGGVFGGRDSGMRFESY